MSDNMDLVPSIQERWDRGDFTWIDWADDDIELEDAVEFREVDSERVLVLIQFKGRAKASGMQLGDVDARNASVHHIRNGKVIKLILYQDRDRALADLGLKG